MTGFWGFKAPTPPDFDALPPGVFAGTRAEWESLSPGYRREIVRKIGVDAPVKVWDKKSTNERD